MTQDCPSFIHTPPTRTSNPSHGSHKGGWVACDGMAARGSAKLGRNFEWPAKKASMLDLMSAKDRHQAQEEPAANLRSWFPPDSGVLERIAALRAEYPDGFEVTKRKIMKRASFWNNMSDCDPDGFLHMASIEVECENKARWRRIKGSLWVYLMEQAGKRAPDPAAEA